MYICHVYIYECASLPPLPPHHPSAVIRWSSHPSLPQTTPSSSGVTYHVYVNRQLKEAVAASPGVMTAHLREIPRHQLVRISIRTVTEEGEGPDPANTIVLNPRKCPSRLDVYTCIYSATCL